MELLPALLVLSTPVVSFLVYRCAVGLARPEKLDPSKFTSYNHAVLSADKLHFSEWDVVRQYIWCVSLDDYWHAKRKTKQIQSTDVWVKRLIFLFIWVFLAGGFYLLSRDLTAVWSTSLVSFSSPLTVFLALSTVLDTVLFVASVFIVGRWPIDTAEGQEVNESTGDRETGVLLIACHKSTIVPEKQETFKRTITAALECFRPENIYVCDNANDESPPDNTEEVCRRLNGEIRYVYIPNGNKTLAFYWTLEYWIPHLHRHGVISCMPTRVTLIDDDTQLPASFKPVGGEGVAQSYALLAARTTFWSKLQDMEYRFVGLTKYAQSKLGGILWGHGAVSSWSRDVLVDRSLYDHNTVFDGEDMTMGKLLQELPYPPKYSYRADIQVTTEPPDNFFLWMRQRVFSWEKCAHRNLFAFIRMLFARSTSHHLRPFLFADVLSLLIDWIRPFMFVLGVVYFPYSLLAATGITFGLTWISVLVLQLFVLRGSLRLGVLESILYPLYKLLHGFTRWAALVHNAWVYYPRFRIGANHAISSMEYNQLPPLPPISQPDWGTVYRATMDDIPASKRPPPVVRVIEERFGYRCDAVLLGYVQVGRLMSQLGSSARSLFQGKKHRKTLHRLFMEQMREIEHLYEQVAIDQYGTRSVIPRKAQCLAVLLEYDDFPITLEEVCSYAYSIQAPHGDLAVEALRQAIKDLYGFFQDLN